MRGLRIAAPARQLTLYGSNTAEGWDQLPERARVEVLSLLARLIARGVFEEDQEAGDG